MRPTHVCNKGWCPKGPPLSASYRCAKCVDLSCCCLSLSGLALVDVWNEVVSMLCGRMPWYLWCGCFVVVNYSWNVHVHVYSALGSTSSICSVLSHNYLIFWCLQMRNQSAFWNLICLVALLKLQTMNEVSSEGKVMSSVMGKFIFTQSGRSCTHFPNCFFYFKVCEFIWKCTHWRVSKWTSAGT